MLDVRRCHRVLALVPILAAAALLAQRSATAQQPRPLTLDALYHPEKKADFSVPRATLTWLDDDYYIAQGGRAARRQRREARRGAGLPHRQDPRRHRQERAVVRRLQADRRDRPRPRRDRR